MRSLDIAVPPMEVLESWIGPPIQDSFREILKTDDSVRVQAAVDLFRGRFKDVGIYENEVYPGIPEALAELVASGHVLMLATSKPEPFAIRILEHFDLYGFFTKVFGSAFDGSHSDKGDLIRHILATESLDPSVTVMVGDRKYDVIGAYQAGISCIGVLYGYGSREELVEAGAAALCESPAKLVHHFAT